MKKNLFLLVFFFAAIGYTKAQTNQLFDMDFEHWSHIGSYDDPDSLRTTNQYTSLAGAVLVTKGTDPYHASNSLKLTSTHISFFTINGTYPGIATNGVINSGILSGAGSPIVSGKKITYRPSAFSCYYKNAVAGHDSSLISIFLTKWNSGMGKRDTVGSLIWIDTVAHANYTHLLAPITYFTAATPDTFQISMMSSGIYHANVGSILTLDSMNFAPDTAHHGNIGVAAIVKPIEMQIVPNPATSFVQLHFNELKEEALLQITALDGKLLINQAVKSATTLDVSSWTNGTYVVAVRTHAGQLLAEKKIQVSH